jgi:hypothetical protein
MGAVSTEARYSVYQRCDNQLVPKEFAFTLDNVRPFTLTSWFCLHDRERETFLLANLVGILRADDGFRRDFDARLDGMLAEHGTWIRQEDGSLAAPSRQRPPAERLAARLAISEQLRAEGLSLIAGALTHSRCKPREFG